jgi:hypothetical protein
LFHVHFGFSFWETGEALPSATALFFLSPAGFTGKALSMYFSSGGLGAVSAFPHVDPC